MWQPKDYPVKCHVCGREYTRRSEFLSGMAWVVGDREFTVYACPGKHSREQVRDAYLKITGQRPEAFVYPSGAQINDTLRVIEIRCRAAGYEVAA